MRKQEILKKGVALGSVVTMVSTMIVSAAGEADTRSGDDTANAQTNKTEAKPEPIQVEEGENEKPNIVYLVLDDVGFGDLGCYGSSISTPNMDRLAKSGIQYTNYVTSPMSSPSRASMLTGFESNNLGMGSVSDIDLGELVPNIQGTVRPECGFITHSLKENGYNTMALGKWHLATMSTFMPDGDKEQWPSGRGFDMNYNYIGSQTNQFDPGGMIEGDNYIVPDTSDPNYHLTNDLLSKTLDYIDSTKDEEPFFAYVALGAMHGPFNVTEDYIEKYKGVFDKGWDAEREKIFARQKELGIFSAETEMPKGSEKVAPWDSLSEKEKEVARKHMEVYAAFMEHTDAQIGKFMDELDAKGELDNTMFVLVSDNGANSNGGPNGGFAHDVENIYNRDFEEQYGLMDQFGNAQYGTQYNSGWAMTSNTPFQNFKTNAHYGGIRTACLVSWPAGMKEPGRLNKDIITVYDIPATVLDITGTKRLTTVNDVKQDEMQGISFAETFSSSKERINQRDSYALMMFMDRTYTKGGYTIVTNVKSGEWELYNTSKDETQMNNLAEEQPEKLEEMVKEYQKVAKEEQNVQNLVMDLAHKESIGTIATRYALYPKTFWDCITNIGEYSKIIKAISFKPEGVGYAGTGSTWYRRPDSPQSAKEYTYTKEDSPFFALSGAQTVSISHNITTKIDIEDGDEGVIYAHGGIDGGYVIYIKDGQLIYENNYVGDRQKVVSSTKMVKGSYDIELEYQKKTHSSGTAILKVDGKETGKKDIRHLAIFPSYDYTSIGEDAGSKVNMDYKDDFPFTGEMSEIKINLGDDLWE